MVRLALPGLLVLAVAPACYLSHSDLDDAGDAGLDAETDARPDAGDTGPVGRRFVDQDIPDRSIPVGLYFAAVPAVAWNGRVAGVVYHGREPGADERIAFIPLDSRGVPVGPERQIRSGRGVASVIPQIAADGDDFIVAFLEEGSMDTLVVLRVNAAGEVTDSAESAVVPGVRDPTVPPVVLSGSIYLPFLPVGSDDLVRVLRVRRGTSFGTPEPITLCGLYASHLALVEGC